MISKGFAASPSYFSLDKEEAFYIVEKVEAVTGGDILCRVALDINN